MRIIAGIYRSRPIKMVDSIDTRETTDKVRGAIFNIINPYFNGGVVLDLFAGSGAMGLEALSRGASFAYFNDISMIAIKTINTNIKTLKISDFCVLKEDYLNCLKTLKRKDIKLDCVFLDPPYKMEVIDEIIEYMITNTMLNDNALIVCEYGIKNQLKNHDLIVLKEKEYRIRKVSIYAYGEKK